MDKTHTISVVVPAYNEEKNLENAISSLVPILEPNFKDYEILIFNDHSSDKTGEIADRLAHQNNKIKIVHNKTNMGFGYNYTKASEIAKMEFFSLFPGDNENTAESFYDALEKISKADIVIPYPINTEVRTFFRNFVSRSYTVLLNSLFGLNLKYFNGTVVYKTKVLQSVKVTTYGFAYSSEILVKLLKQGHKYTEVGIKITAPTKSSAFKPKNVYRVITTVLRLFYEVNLKNRKKYNKKSILVE